jgi:hypothetical protein
MSLHVMVTSPTGSFFLEHSIYKRHDTTGKGEQKANEALFCVRGENLCLVKLHVRGGNLHETWKVRRCRNDISKRVSFLMQVVAIVHLVTEASQGYFEFGARFTFGVIIQEDDKTTATT